MLCSTRFQCVLCVSGAPVLCVKQPVPITAAVTSLGWKQRHFQSAKVTSAAAILANGVATAGVGLVLASPVLTGQNFSLMFCCIFNPEFLMTLKLGEGSGHSWFVQKALILFDLSGKDAVFVRPNQAFGGGK